MLYKLLVVLHLIGASVWVGGHIVLVGVVLPEAFREYDAKGIHNFERGYGRIGLATLALQFATGLWLATIRVPDLRTIFTAPTPAGHLVLAKLALLGATVILAGHTYHRVLPRLSVERMRPFAVHAWATTVLSILLLIAGAGIRLGGLL